MESELGEFDSRAFTIPSAQIFLLLCFKQVSELPTEVLMPFGKRMSTWVTGVKGKAPGSWDCLIRAAEAHLCFNISLVREVCFLVPYHANTHTHTRARAHTHSFTKSVEVVAKLKARNVNSTSWVCLSIINHSTYTRRLRHREVIQLVHSHTASKWQNQDLSLKTESRLHAPPL